MIFAYKQYDKINSRFVVFAESTYEDKDEKKIFLIKFWFADKTFLTWEFLRPEERNLVFEDLHLTDLDKTQRELVKAQLGIVSIMGGQTGRSCVVCGNGLPADYIFDVCQKCHKE